MKSAGKYIPPHQRKRLVEGGSQPTSRSSGGFQSSGRPTTQNLAMGGKWDGPRDTGRYEGGSRGGGFGGGGFGRGGGGGGGFGGGWREPKQEYGPDGLLPPNPALEKELFGGGSHAGINFDQYDEIDVEVAGNNLPGPMETFSDIDLGMESFILFLLYLLVVGAVVNNNVALAEFQRPTPVQKYSIPIILDKRDLMACAQTGSGKTGAFLFPLISLTISDPPPPIQQEGYSRRYFKAYPSTLVLAPTRELASQIADEAKKFTYRSHLKVFPLLFRILAVLFISRLSVSMVVLSSAAKRCSLNVALTCLLLPLDVSSI